MAADICRLCLRTIDKAKSIDLVAETTKFAMLKQFLPEMNLDITENTQVCSNCIQELEVSYNFKQSVVVNEANIQTKLEENKLKKIDLKSMLDDVAKKELKEDDYVCRTCLLICRTPSISLFDTPSNMMPCSFVKKMCQLVFELEFIASDKPVLCDECWETLQTVYNFRKCCLKTDKKLRTYVAKKNLKKLGVEEFKKFVEENPPIDNDEVSSDDELDGYIKEEPIDEEELKFDPEEASCSSASLKFKEETTVKSESDEDMEDEPELLDPKALKSETSELDGEDCKLEIGDVKVDAEGEGAAGPSGSKHKEPRKKYGIKLPGPRILQCPQCNYSTHLKQHLTKHMVVHRTASEMMHCNWCDFKTKFRRSLVLHLNRHQTNNNNVRILKYYCAHCSYGSNTKHSLVEHLVKHNFVHNFECSKCSYKTNKERLFKNHMVSHDSDEYFCCYHCTYATKYKLTLVQHMVTHMMPKLDEPLQCFICSSTFSIKLNLINHVKRHMEIEAQQRLTCAKCSFTTKFKERLEAHMIVHDPKALACPKCPFVAKHKRDLKVHVIVHSKKKIYQCNNCPFNSLYRHSLKRHFRKQLCRKLILQYTNRCE